MAETPVRASATRSSGCSPPLDWVALQRRSTRLCATPSRSPLAAGTRSIPGTILFTGSVNRDVGCSGSWLAHHEYVVDDVNKWSFLARSGRLAGATSIATHGDLSRSARHRSHEAFGIGDELRVSLRRRRHLLGRRGLPPASRARPGSPNRTSGAWPHWRPSARASAARCCAPDSTARRHPSDDGPGVVVFDATANPSPSRRQRTLDRRVGRGSRRRRRRPNRRSVQAIAARARAIAPGTIRSTSPPGPAYAPVPAPGCCCTGPGSPAARRTHRRHHPTRHAARDRAAHRPGLRPDRARMPVHCACVQGRPTREIAQRAVVSRPTRCKTTSSRSSTRPGCAAAANWWGRSSSSTTRHAGSLRHPRHPDGGRRASTEFAELSAVRICFTASERRWPRFPPFVAPAPVGGLSRD